MKMTFFVHLKATEEWLSLLPDERAEFNRMLMQPTFSKHPSVHARFYDAEAFTSKCSDIAVFETDDVSDYYALMDELRDSKLYTAPYFELIDIVPAIENRQVGATAFAELEQARG